MGLTPPPPFEQCSKKLHFSYGTASLSAHWKSKLGVVIDVFRPSYQVHQCVKCPPEDLLREDDRHLASVQPHHPLCRGDFFSFLASLLFNFVIPRCSYKLTSSTCAVLWRRRRRSTITEEKLKLTSSLWQRSRLLLKSLTWSKFLCIFWARLCICWILFESWSGPNVV